MEGRMMYVNLQLQRTLTSMTSHTDPRWGGSFDLVRKARQLTFKPIPSRFRKDG